MSNLIIWPQSRASKIAVLLTVVGVTAMAIAVIWEKHSNYGHGRAAAVGAVREFLRRWSLPNLDEIEYEYYEALEPGGIGLPRRIHLSASSGETTPIQVGGDPTRVGLARIPRFGRKLKGVRLPLAEGSGEELRRFHFSGRLGSVTISSDWPPRFRTDRLDSKQRVLVVAFRDSASREETVASFDIETGQLVESYGSSIEDRRRSSVWPRAGTATQKLRRCNRGP